MFFRAFYILVILILLVNYNLSLAKDKLDIKMEAFLVNFEKKGKEFVVNRKPLPKEVKPGDIIEYRILVENKTQKTFKNVFIRSHIPKGTKYIENSSTDGALFSIDNGKTYSKPPVKYKVKENGKEVEKIAKPEMYTNIGWNIKEIKPGDKEIFIYWVKVKE